MELELFRCERRAVTLTRQSCAAFWTAAESKRPEPWEGRWHCRGCPIGAGNAGKGPQETAAFADSLRFTCPRCDRPSGRLVQDRLCISCYNREREARLGRNAKGGRPRLCGQLHAETLAVSEGGRIRTERFDSVTSMPEAMRLATKRATAEIAFGRSRPVLLHNKPQMELGL